MSGDLIGKSAFADDTSFFKFNGRGLNPQPMPAQDGPTTYDIEEIQRQGHISKALASRLTSYAQLRDQGVRQLDAAQEIGVSRGTSERYEHWYLSMKRSTGRA